MLGCVIPAVITFQEFWRLRTEPVSLRPPVSGLAPWAAISVEGVTTAKIVVAPTLIEQAKQLKREDVWAALPYRVRSNPFIMVDLDKADCERAPAAYKG